MAMDDPVALVLVVDDVEAIVEELLTLFQLQRIPAVGAGTLNQAIAELEVMPSIRVIVCDVHLKRESGLDIVPRIKDNALLATRGFHYVFVTGDPMGAFSLPSTFHHSVLTKPVRPRVLMDTVRKLLAENK